MNNLINFLGWYTFYAIIVFAVGGVLCLIIDKEAINRSEIDA